MPFKLTQIRWSLLYLVLAAGLVAGYLLGLQGELGFPLDDAWIHQTYARNLAQTGRWEYVPGETSAGSTAPLWTALLAIGYWLGLPYQVWTWGLGAVTLALTGRLAHRVAEVIFPKPVWAGPAAGLLTVTEWHLVWAAASGMETVLYAALVLAVVEQAAWENWAAVGALGGLLVLTRPEGVLLLGLVALRQAWLAVRGRWSLRRVWQVGAAAGVPFAVLMLLYLVLNLRLGGRPWPNTFYAKQAEYASLLAEPLLLRLGRIALPPLAGLQVLLLPGIGLLFRRRERSQAGLLALLAIYAALHWLLYALRLPVTYQHGRYLFPAIPPLLICGVGGMAGWVHLRHPAAVRRVLSRVWLAAVAVLAAVFFLVGARAYAQDVQVIQGEMVAVAHWLSQHTEPGEQVAAHDIGAIGYFAGRPLLDLAGLISPDVVPLMDDEAALTDYVLTSSARYLVTAPGWSYPALTDRPEVIALFSADVRLTRMAGLNNSTVYRLPENAD